jgi:hypothetical protein
MQMRAPALAIFLSLILFSCKKDEVITDAPGTRLIEVITTRALKDSTGITFLKYDSQNKLVTVIDSFRMQSDNVDHYIGLSFSRPLEYDAQGKLAKVTYREGSGSDVYDLLYYNSDAVAIQRLRYSQLENDTLIAYYTYDNKKRLISDSTYNNKNKGLVDFSTYSWDDKDNLVEWKRFTNASGTLQMIASMQASYDENTNPYHALGMTLYPFRRKEQVLSKNNIVREIYSDGISVSYEYAYYSNGLPKGATVATASLNGLVSRKVEFIYE